MTRHQPLGAGCLFAIVVLLLAVGIGALLVLVVPYRPRPADLTPTPYIPTVVVDPTRPVVAPPTMTPSPESTEAILATPLPTATTTPSPTPTVPPTPTPSPVETRTPTQKG